MPRVMGLVCVAALLALSSGVSAQPGVAYLAVDLRTRTTIASERLDRIDAPVAPGSVMKIATLAAALESGVIGEGTSILCPRQVVVDGHRLTCTHPDLHRPLKPAEALAQSCNGYFATVASRLPRAALDRALADLGLPPSDRSRPVAAAALGVEGIRVPPRALLDMIARVAAEPSTLGWKASTLTVVRAGLAAAATTGTAAALAANGVSALAKTGTVIGANGLSQGLVVGVTPAVQPKTGFVLMVSGGAGVDATALAATRLKAAAPQASTLVHVGVARRDGGYDIRALSLDDYVAGVVAAEAAPASTPAALDALAITVRTFALANRGRHAADGFDLCDLTHCQVLRPPTPASTTAARGTTTRVLLDGRSPADVYYTASCGGFSERPSNVWPGAKDPPFLPSRADDACKGAPQWTDDLTAADVMRALRAGGFKGDLLRDLRISKRTESGRAATLVLDGFAPREISGATFRSLIGRTLGWQHLKSTAFDVRRTGAGYRFSGHGAGHGVGLCVIGSSRLAERGLTAEAILARYFPGLTIGAWTPPAASSARLTVVLPPSERHETDAVTNIATRALGDLVDALAVSAPNGIRLRFHPTVESYERETGQPWFTSAATRGAEVQLLPRAVLLERGILETTIRHELAHILTASVLAGRSRWVLEGAALYFAGEGVPGNTAGACPADDELRRAASPQALQSAYARAAACFAREVRSGVSWREVR